MKATGAIPNLVQGVSTQNPKERLAGQAWAMTNMIPDPVEGAVKRTGVKHIKSVIAALPSPTLGLDIQFKELAIGNSDYAVGTYDGRIVMRNLVTGDAVPVEQEPSSVAYFSGGVATSTNIGEYTLLSGTAIPEVQQQILPSIHSLAYTNNTNVATASVNRVVVIEIRQGSYSGIYAIKRSDGSSLATFTVPNGATGTDSVQVQPAYIAGQLYSQMQSSIGASVGSGVIRAVHQVGANLAIFLDYTAVDEAAALFADDGYYNTRMIMSDRFSSALTALPAIGVEGHVMEVGKENSKQGNYFVRFEHTQGGSTSATPSLLTNQLRLGRWVETSRSYSSTGYSTGGILKPETLPSLLYLFNGKAYVGTGEYIAARVLNDTSNVIEPLKWGKRETGSSDSASDPLFVGSRIVWMGVFQDRLVILSEGAVSMSRTSDYLNFYRQSVIDDLATDPINITSTFDTTDQLVGAALLDKNLVVIGTKTHYAIVGRTGITPTNAAMLKTSAFESSPNVAPVSFGNLVYFSSASAANSDILAIQPSDSTDSTYAYPVSSHVDGYITGDLVALHASTKLNILFTLSASGVLYGYRTLFNQGDRVLSSWFDFAFGTDMKLNAIALDNTKIRMIFTRIVGTELYTTVGLLDLDRVGYTGVNRHRYLDFWVDEAFASLPHVDDSARARAVFSKEAPVVVDSLSNLADGSGAQLGQEVVYYDLVPTRTYMTGIPFLTTYDPTMPLPRNQEGKVMGTGKLVIGQMKINYTVGAQFTVYVTDKYRNGEYQHSARVVSAPDSLVEHDYVRSGFCLFPIGSSEADARVSIQSYDHYPLVLSSIDWTGQLFKRGVSM